MMKLPTSAYFWENKKKSLNSLQILLKLTDNVRHEKNTTRVVEVKSGRESVVSTESDGGGEQTEMEGG